MGGSIRDYASLQQAVADWLARDDLAARLPDFIDLCERRLNSDLRLIEMERITTLMAVPGQKLIRLPYDFMEPRSIFRQAATVRVLDPLAPDELYGGCYGSSASGDPRVYAVSGGEEAVLDSGTITLATDLSMSVTGAQFVALGVQAQDEVRITSGAGLGTVRQVDPRAPSPVTPTTLRVNPNWMGTAITGCNYEILAPAHLKHLHLGPTPDAAYTLRVLYYARIPPLMTDTAPERTYESNWLLELAPELYLYGALLEAEPFLHNDKRVGLWQERFDRAVAAHSNNSERAKWSGGTLRVRSDAVAGM